MSRQDRSHSEKSGRTLLTALLLSAPGPLVTLFAAVTSRSATQLADFLRRTAELVATLVSWLVFRKLGKDEGMEEAAKQRLERLADLAVAWAMVLSGAALCVVGTVRLFVYTPSGNAVSGLVIAALGLVVNTFFWLRYRKLTREEYSSVIAAQQRLYRAKASVDLCVVAALLAVVIAPEHPATRYVDAVGSLVVAAYLLYNGVGMLRSMRSKAGGKIV